MKCSNKVHRRGMIPYTQMVAFFHRKKIRPHAAISLNSTHGHCFGVGFSFPCVGFANISFEGCLREATENEVEHFLRSCEEDRADYGANDTAATTCIRCRLRRVGPSACRSASRRALHWLLRGNRSIQSCPATNVLDKEVHSEPNHHALDNKPPNGPVLLF